MDFLKQISSHCSVHAKANTRKIFLFFFLLVMVIFSLVLPLRSFLLLFSPFDLFGRQPVRPGIVWIPQFVIHTLDTCLVVISSWSESLLFPQTFTFLFTFSSLGTFVLRRQNVKYRRFCSFTICALFSWCFVLPFMLPVPFTTPDQATNYGCWHEPPCNLKSTSLSPSPSSALSFLLFAFSHLIHHLLFNTPLFHLLLFLANTSLSEPYPHSIYYLENCESNSHNDNTNF